MGPLRLATMPLLVWDMLVLSLLQLTPDTDMLPPQLLPMALTPLPQLPSLLPQLSDTPLLVLPPQDILVTELPTHTTTLDKYTQLLNHTSTKKSPLNHTSMLKYQLNHTSTSSQSLLQ